MFVSIFSTAFVYSVWTVLSVSMIIPMLSEMPINLTLLVWMFIVMFVFCTTYAALRRKRDNPEAVTEAEWYEVERFQLTQFGEVEERGFTNFRFGWFSFIFVVFGLILSLFMFQTFQDDPFIGVKAYYPAVVSLVGLSCGTLYNQAWKRRMTFTDFTLSTKLVNSLVGFVAGFGSMAVVTWFSSVFQSSVGVDVDTLFAFYGAMGVGEELFFRMLLLPFFFDLFYRMRSTVSLVKTSESEFTHISSGFVVKGICLFLSSAIVSLFFMTFHSQVYGSSPDMMFTTFMFSMATCIAFYITKDFTVCLTIHAANNLIAAGYFPYLLGILGGV